MDFVKLFNEVKQEFDEETAILVVVAETIALTKKPKFTDASGETSFSERCTKKLKKVACEYSVDHINTAVKIQLAYYDFEECAEMNCIGGCNRKTLKECFDNVR